MMENKFTPRAEEALRLAQEAAEDMGHGYVGCEHILLGLMREEDGIAHRVMQEYGMTEDMICTVLERSVGKGMSGAAPTQGLTPRAKSAVELAVSEAMRTGAGYIGTEHLLMGLLREGNNMAIRVLDTVGIDPKKMYSSVVQKINEGPRASAGSAPAPHREDGKKGKTLAEFTRDLTEAARQGNKKPFKCVFHCVHTCDQEKTPYCIAQALISAMKGNLERGFAFCGANVARVNSIVSVKELMESLQQEFDQTISKGKQTLQGLLK